MSNDPVFNKLDEMKIVLDRSRLVQEIKDKRPESRYLSLKQQLANVLIGQ